jgi:hypothetical protein
MGSPIKILGEIEESKEEILWVPPGVQKGFTCYPFNIIWGRAAELLDCDVLRVIGSSLSQNDWEILSLLFRTQLMHKSGGYDIELIIHEKPTNQIMDNYSFLSKTVSFPGIRECSDASDLWGKPDFNPFKFWLQCRGRELIKNGINIDSLKHFSDVVSEGAT